MLTEFSREQLDAASRLSFDSDFKQIIHYIVKEVTKLSLQTVRVSGSEKETMSGACIAMEELRDKLVTASDTIKKLKENEELESFQKDPISF